MNADTVVFTLSSGDRISFSPNPHLAAAVQAVCDQEHRLARSTQDHLATTQQALELALEQIAQLKERLSME